MTRGLSSRDRSPSYVKWPTDMEDTGEGGMAVFLVVPESNWPECCINMPTLQAHDVIVRGQEKIEREVWGFSQYDGPRNGHLYDDTGLQAVICLGTTGGSYLDDENGYFVARVEDLTLEGATLYALIRKLYGVEPMLLTFLDT